jgi:hypothetical protein
MGDFWRRNPAEMLAETVRRQHPEADLDQDAIKEAKALCGAPSYRCACCGGIFEEGWSEEEALTERDALFGQEVAAGEEFALVCDGCWRKNAGVVEAYLSQRGEEDGRA